MSIAREFDRWASHPETCHGQINGRRCGFVAQRTCPGCDLALCSTCSHQHECKPADVQLAITNAITDGGDEAIHLAQHGCTRAEMLEELYRRQRAGFWRRGE